MINLCSNIYVTYAHTKQFYYNTDSLIVSKIRIKHMESETSKVIKQVKELPLLIGNPINFFNRLISLADSSPGLRIVIYLDPSAFQEFIVKWLLSSYRNMDKISFIELINAMSDIEKSRSSGLRFQDYNGLDINYEEIHDLYWKIDPSVIDDVYSSKSYYDVDEVYSNRNFESLICNSILGDETSIKELKSKMPRLLKRSIIREFGKSIYLFTEKFIQTAHNNPDIGNKVTLGSDFYSDILESNPIYSRLMSQYNNKSDIFDNDLDSVALVVADLFANCQAEVPLCTYYKKFGRYPTVDELFVDIIDADSYELLYYYFDNNRYSPDLVEFIRSKSKSGTPSMYLSFGPQEI